MTETPQVLLQHRFKKLRLPTFQSAYAKLAQQCSAENKDHVQYLLRLCELELIERERRMIEGRIWGPLAPRRGAGAKRMAHCSTGEWPHFAPRLTGETALHLCGVTPQACFVGYSR